MDTKNIVTSATTSDTKKCKPIETVFIVNTFTDQGDESTMNTTGPFKTRLQAFKSFLRKDLEMMGDPQKAYNYSDFTAEYNLENFIFYQIKEVSIQDDPLSQEDKDLLTSIQEKIDNGQDYYLD